MNSAVPVKRRLWIIFSYFAVLTLIIGLGSGLAGLPISFLLKDKLKLSSPQMAFYGLLTGIPSYVGFLLGFLRDRWRPVGWGDRGYMFLMPIVMALSFITLSFIPLNYTTLLTVSLLNGFAGTMLGAAFNGLTTAVAQRNLMTGRLTAVGTFIGVIPGILSSLLGGQLTEKVPIPITFRICAGLMIFTSLLALWRPSVVFEGEHERHPASMEPLGKVARGLLAHKPLWPAALMQLFWVIMPGWGTPLFFYLTNTVKLKPDQIGVVFSIGPMATLLMSLVYGMVCRHVPFQRLLLIGVITGIIGAPLAMLIKDYTTAILVFAVAVTLFGIGNCAINDLLLRSYPKGLEGTGATLLNAIAAAAGASSNLFGAWLYEKSGFGMAMLVSTCCTAAMLPVLFFIPRSVTVSRDGEMHTEILGDTTAVTTVSTG